MPEEKACEDLTHEEEKINTLKEKINKTTSTTIKKQQRPTALICTGLAVSLPPDPQQTLKSNKHTETITGKQQQRALGLRGQFYGTCSKSRCRCPGQDSSKQVLLHSWHFLRRKASLRLQRGCAAEHWQ